MNNEMWHMASSKYYKDIMPETDGHSCITFLLLSDRQFSLIGDLDHQCHLSNQITSCLDTNWTQLNLQS